MTIAAGKLRHRIEIQTLTDADVGDGTFTSTYSTAATVWASIQPLRGREFMEAQQTTGRATHRVTMRSYPALTIKHRLVFGGRTFGIEAVQHVDERPIMTQAMVVEIV